MLPQTFKAIAAAIKSHPGSWPVTLEFQQCDRTVQPDAESSGASLQQVAAAASADGSGSS